ncbi:hypothetical protein CYMTET_17712 [Cymbomonas tetramitiformis]|uniref:Uncharacterized protein n=1 Tax=Cymbomonas tetramitiformis TaxID=36881 RepID=A0AAE0L716_9CHLO|nr:hypothetical protein CYMTET_17712 [Cymbomonas tetramitiformis]
MEAIGGKGSEGVSGKVVEGPEGPGAVEAVGGTSELVEGPEGPGAVEAVGGTSDGIKGTVVVEGFIATREGYNVTTADYNAGDAGGTRLNELMRPAVKSRSITSVSQPSSVVAKVLHPVDVGVGGIELAVPVTEGTEYGKLMGGFGGLVDADHPQLRPEVVGVGVANPFHLEAKALHHATAITGIHTGGFLLLDNGTQILRNGT